MIRVIKTEDGSSSLFREDLNERYHSVHGAYSESMHVFIDAGLKRCSADPLWILEMGFGTGLNCFLTFLNSDGKEVYYTSLETFPLGPEIISELDFSFLSDHQNKNVFKKIHNCERETVQTISENFNLKKLKISLLDFQSSSNYDLIYFDAFAPDIQPELWTSSVFEKLYSLLNPNGILVTYCAKGYVKRNLRSVGFEVNGLPGPKGKREMTLAVKRDQVV